MNHRDSLAADMQLICNVSWLRGASSLKYTTLSLRKGLLTIQHDGEVSPGTPMREARGRQDQALQLASAGLQ